MPVPHVQGYESYTAAIRLALHGGLRYGMEHSMHRRRSVAGSGSAVDGLIGSIEHSQTFCNMSRIPGGSADERTAAVWRALKSNGHEPR